LHSSDHYLPLLLNAKLKMALIKFQADRELGQTYAGLLSLAEGLHSLKYLSDEDYLFCITRYSEKLVEKSQKSLTPEEKKQKHFLETMTRTFVAVLSEWGDPKIWHKEGWRERWIQQAEKFKDQIPEAKQLLQKVAEK
jgi:hypothetical protein